MDLKTLWNKIAEFHNRNALTIWMVIGVIIGIVTAVIMKIVREEPYNEREVMYFGFLGEIFLRMLQGIVLPLVGTCLMLAFAKIDKSISGRLGIQFLLLYMITKIICVFLGILVTYIAQPGKVADVGGVEQTLKPANLTMADNFLDIIRNIFPDNYIELTFKQFITDLIPPENVTKLPPKEEWEISSKMVNGVNMLGLICVSICFGIAINILEDSAKALLDVTSSLNQATYVITKWIIYISPFMLIFLVGAEVLRMKEVSNALANLGAYIGIYLALLVIQGCLVYPLVTFLLTGTNPFVIYGIFARSIITAFAIASSLATIPVSIECFQNAGYDQRLINFVIPIGANINKDGAATFYAVATLFIAQLNGISFTVGQYVSLFILSMTTSVAAPAIPLGSIIILVMVLQSLGVPTDDIGLLMAVDWLLDRFQTLINALGDAFILHTMQHWNRKYLENTSEGGSLKEIKTR